MGEAATPVGAVGEHYTTQLEILNWSPDIDEEMKLPLAPLVMFMTLQPEIARSFMLLP